MPNTTPLFSFCCQGYNSGPLCPPFARRPGGGPLHFVLEARPGKGHCAHLSSFPFLSLLPPFLTFLSFFLLRFKIYKLGLPCSSSGEKSTCQYRGHGFNPWSGKIPHATGQLSLCTTNTESASLEPVLHNKRSHRNEKPAHHNERAAPARCN